MSPPRRRVRRTLKFLFILSLLVLGLLIGPPSAGIDTASASHSVPVTVTITRLTNLGDEGIEDNLRGEADLYACVFIFADGLSSEKCTFDTHKDDDDDVEPFVDNPAGATLTTNVPGELGSVAIVMEVWDHDGCSFARCFFDPDPFGESDDQGDADPGAGNNVDLSLNLATGVWSGDTPGSCLAADPNVTDSAVRICWDISTISASGDADGDGLLDSWESRGYDADGDGTIDVDLPAFGADPLHKDLFLELDIVAGQSPRRDDIQGMIAAFAAAPINAGSAAASQIAPNGGAGLSAPDNPDGQRGINIHVDTGAAVDPNGIEGAVPNCQDGIDNGGDGTIDVNDTDCQNQSGNRNYLDVSIEDPPATNCGDGVDNDTDGQIDGADTDCLIGDNLGGGNTVPRVGCLDAAFYTAKGANFNANRRHIFRYAISGNPADNNPCRGGQGEIGGNDFVEFNHDGGTIMHELGHTLNLHHGGNDDNNCKPSYVSGMDYNEQFGIFRPGGGGMLDYSPPRIALDGSTRGVAPLSTLVENALTEPTTLDTTDTANQFVFTNGNGTRVFNNLNQPANWNGDAADPPFEAGPLTVNIDNATGSPARPSACVNSATNSTLTGFHDWNAISMTFRQFGDSANGAVNFEPEVVPTLEDFEQLLQELNTTDLSITKFDSPDPVTAGELLFYTITVSNIGPNQANNVKVTDSLSPGLIFEADTDACIEAPAGTLTCSLGAIPAGDSRSVTIVVRVPADYVATTGPVGIKNTANVENVGGTDTDPGNNTAQATTIVVDEADLRLTKECKPDQPNKQPAGTETFCDIYVDNLGPSDARNVVVTDQIISSTPVVITGLDLSSTSGSPGSCSPATPTAPVTNVTVTCTDSLLPAGARNTIKVRFQAEEEGDADDTASVTSNTPDPNTSNNLAIGRVSFAAVADLSITKSDSEDPLVSGTSLTYTLLVHNDGPSTAVNVRAEDLLPAGVSINSVSGTGGAACVSGVPGDNSHPTVCTFGSIPSGGSRTMTVVVTVLPGIHNSLHNNARVSSDVLDLNNANNVDSEDTQIRVTDLEIVKTADGDTYKASGTVIYTIEVTNHGPSDAHGVVVTDNLPLEKRDRVIFFSPIICTKPAGSTLLTCNLGSIAAGQSASVTVVVVYKGNRGLVNNTADVTSTTNDTVPGNNTSTASVLIGTPPKP